MQGIQIVQYTKQDLKQLLAQEQFWTQPRLPITKRRALSHVSNPRADDSDTVLITAFIENQLIAYLGILPDRLMSERHEPMKFGWMSTWWVDKESNRRLSAAMILFAALEKYSNRLAGSSPSSEAERVCVATKRFKQGVRLDRMYFIMAPPPSFRLLSPVIRWVTDPRNRIISSRKLESHGLEVRTVTASDVAFESFVNARAVEDPLARDSTYWKWVLEYPWMSAGAEDEAAQERYAFSVFAKDFQQVPILISRQGTVIALLVLTLRNGYLTLKYSYYDLCDAADVAMALRITVGNINPCIFVSADSVLNTQLKQLFPFYLPKISKSSPIYAANGLPLSLGRHNHWGTGDLVFT